jgi:GNAT superfamily N-acetyltransferase/rRNA-processing protein FCF1
LRILLDTNFILDVESDAAVQQEHAELVRLCARGHQMLIHPESARDVERDRDEARKGITLSKLNKYDRLERPPDPDAAFLRQVAPSGNPNDLSDARLLFAVEKDAVDFLVTRDNGLRRRARARGLGDRVYDPIEALALLRGLEAPPLRRHTAVESVPVHHLDPNDHFFDSMRVDYGVARFNAWLAKIARSGRRAFVFREADQIRALLIYKHEADSGLPGVPPNVLKIATLKVAEEVRGQKLGELFIKIASREGVRIGARALYVTVYPKHGFLEGLFQEFGFWKAGTKADASGGEEDVLVKWIEGPQSGPAGDPVELVSNRYPCFVDGPRVKKFIVPIQPRFHDRLFPEVGGKQKRLVDFSQVSVEGNTIRKAYLSKSAITTISPGDLLLFYRSKDTRAITSIGVVEKAIRTISPGEATALAGKRTVYSGSEIAKMCEGSPVLVLLFSHTFDGRHPASYGDLVRLGVLKGVPQSTQEISHTAYVAVREVMEVDKRLTFD